MRCLTFLALLAVLSHGCSAVKRLEEDSKTVVAPERDGRDSEHNVKSIGRDPESELERIEREAERKAEEAVESGKMGQLSALIAVADGTEDIEAVTSSDVLRRAGVDVVVASVKAEAKDGSVLFANKMRVVPDAKVAELKDREFSAIVLPGGMPGATHLRDSPELTEMLKKQKAASRVIAAICASPKVVLEHHGLLGDEPSTGYPAFETKNYKRDRVVKSKDGKLITSRGPGTALEFALTIVEELKGEPERNKLQDAMVFVAA